MELKETIEGMISQDYKERFIAEYQQAKIRCGKLGDLLNKWDTYKDYEKINKIVKSQTEKSIKDFLGFEPCCPYDLLNEQYNCMARYLRCLELRAAIEGIDLK